jgi:hypothetical protein
MIGLELLERIVSSRHFVNIAFLIAIITLWRAYRQELAEKARLHQKIERVLEGRNRAVEKVLRERINSSSPSPSRQGRGENADASNNPSGENAWH